MQAKIQTTKKGLTFSKAWVFDIDGFFFDNLNGDELTVKFIIESSPKKSGLDADIWPDEDDPVLIESENRLETILDLIALQTGKILRLDKKTYEFSTQTISSSHSVGEKSIDPPDIKTITAQYSDLKKNGNAEKRAKNSLRLYRLSRYEDNLGERIGQLWGGVEELFDFDVPQLFSEKEAKRLFKDIDNLDYLTLRQKGSIKKRISDARAKGMPEVISERTSLQDSDRRLTNEEKKGIMQSWLAVRSPHSHGNVLRRNEKKESIADDMEDTLELFLEDRLSPRLLHYEVFKLDDLNGYHQSVLLNYSRPEGSYRVFARRGLLKEASFELQKKYLRSELGSVYLVGSHEVFQVRTNSVEKLPQKWSQDELGQLLSKLQQDIWKKLT